MSNLAQRITGVFRSSPLSSPALSAQKSNPTTTTPTTTTSTAEHSSADDAPPPLALPPTSASSSSPAKPQKRHTGFRSICQSKTASSCEVFSMLKALAAGGGDPAGVINVEVDSDDEEEPVPTGGSSGEKEKAQRDELDEKMVASPASVRTEKLPHVESEATVRPGDGDAETKTLKGLDAADDEREKKAALERWMEDSLGKAVSERETLSARFAALSMSNFSPFAEATADHPKTHRAKRRPKLPRAPAAPLAPPIDSAAAPDLDVDLDAEPEPEHPELELEPPIATPSDIETSEPTTSDSESIPSTGVTTPLNTSSDQDHILGPQGEISEEDKLRAIQDEFGDIAGLMLNADGSPAEEERLLAESKGSLFKGIMTLGNLHLTTHRILFHALMPPDAAFVRRNLGDDPSGERSVNAASSITSHQLDVLQSGPVTVHRPGLKGTRRVWMELSSEMITTYPNADETGRVRPLRSVLLSSVKRLEPINEEKPCDFYLTYETADGLRSNHFTVDTEQSAMQWRRAFESALFRHARLKWRRKEAAKRGVHLSPDDHGMLDVDEWNMMRVCVPLDRVQIQGLSDYHHFATLVSLDIDMGEQLGHGSVNTASTMASKIVQGDFSANDGSERMRKRATLQSHSSDLKCGPSSPGLGPKRTGSMSLKDKLPFLRTASPAPGSRTPKSRDASPSRAGGASGNAAGSSGIAVAGPMSTSPKMLAREDLPEPPALTSPPLLTPPLTSPPLSSPPITKPPTKYLSSALPPRLMAAMTGAPQTDTFRAMDVHEALSYTFNVAVLNEQLWFAEALQAAVAAAHGRKYREGVVRPKMILTVAGYDCLASDDSKEHPRDSMEESISLDTDSADEIAMGPAEIQEAALLTDEEKHGAELGKEVRKAEKALMAAKMFGLSEENGIWLKRCYIAHALMPARGHIILTPHFICFWRRATVGADIKYRFRCADIKGAEKAPGIRAAFHGMHLKIHGHHDLRFEFWQKAARDEVVARIEALCTPSSHGSSPTSPLSATSSSNVTDPPQFDYSSASAQSAPSTEASSLSGQNTYAPHTIESILAAPIVEGDAAKFQTHAADILAPPKDALFHTKAFPDEAMPYMPFVANKPWTSTSRLTPRTFTCLTIGSRGDVQPYIALCLRLMKDGHKTVIVTHEEFKGWIEGYGIEHRQAGGDPTALMKLSNEHKMFSPGFFKESLGSFRQWLDDLLVDSWKACHDADVLIESPSTMSGVHIAEALKIPYFRAFTMPWTRTTAYPQAFMVPAFEMGPSFNYSTYVLFDNIIWRATSGQINRWRKKHLGLRATDMSALSVTKVPFLYNFSSAVVPKPLDWHDDITITGYWNLENSDTEWTPPKELEDWMAKAKADGKPIVYIGFGSIVVPRPNAMTKSIIKGVEKSGVRAIIAKGWSSRGGDPSKEGENIVLPPSCFGVDKIPHGWLFPKIQAAMHHGGAGTVGASLRAGIPTLIKPWFGDQFFWAVRVTKLEVGLKVPSLRSDDIASALIRATSDKVMIEKAARVGEKIRAEDGCENAIQAIHYNIGRAAADRTKMTWAK